MQKSDNTHGPLIVFWNANIKLYNMQAELDDIFTPYQRERRRSDA